jgi:type I restriction enzyme R subunit
MPGTPGGPEEGTGLPRGIVTGPGEGVPEIKRYVVDGRVNVAVARERVQYLNAQGKLITESLRDYTRINLLAKYSSLDQFLQAWNDAERKEALLQELEGHGVLLDALAEDVGKDLDPFDMLLHVAWNMPPLTRRERANRVKKRNVFTKYGPTARKVLEALIDKYADQGVQTIESMDVLSVPPLTDLGTPVELVRSFGGKDQYLQALQLLESELYSPRAN